LKCEEVSVSIFINGLSRDAFEDNMVLQEWKTPTYVMMK